MRKLIAFLILVLGFGAGFAVARLPVAHNLAHKLEHRHEKPRFISNPDYTPYDLKADAMANVDAALARAQENGHKVIVVMGANWCHDSRGFAARMDKPAFKALLADHYEVVYVGVGEKPGQKDQNRAVSQRFGIDQITGTPTVFILDKDGNWLNRESTNYWRHAEAIPDDMSYAYLEHYARK